GSCHLVQQQESDSKACPHSKRAPTVAMEAKSTCDCAMGAQQTSTRESIFTSALSRTEISKTSVTGFDLSSKSIPNLFEARPHGPPVSLVLTQQNTYLFNSNLRI